MSTFSTSANRRRFQPPSVRPERSVLPTFIYHVQP
jgi:hypothetical protein